MVKYHLLKSYNVSMPDSLVQFEMDYNNGIYEGLSVKSKIACIILGIVL